MNRDTYVLIAFCIFMLLLGIRLRNHFGKPKEKQAKINRNQRPKQARTDEPAEVKERRLKREKRVRRFTIIQLVVLFGLMIYMIPALVNDLTLPAGGIDFTNLFLRCLIFLLTIYIFILGYIKVFGRKNKPDQPDEEQG